MVVPIVHTHEAVIFGIGDDRVVEHIIAVVVVIQLPPEIIHALLCCFFVQGCPYTNDFRSILSELQKKQKMPVSESLQGASALRSQRHNVAAGPLFRSLLKPALLTHFGLDLHSISQTRPVYTGVTGLRHAHRPSGRLFSPSGCPSVLGCATCEKLSPSALTPVEIRMRLP